MPSLIQPGTLLLLLLGLLLIAVFAAMFYSRTPAPAQIATPFPPVTLTVYRGPNLDSYPRPGPGVLRTASPAGPPEDIIRRTASLTSYLPLQLEANPPACYESSAESLLCLGWIYNPGPQRLGDVRVRVELRDTNAQLLQAMHSTLEQRSIAPGQAAPYRVQFNHISNRPVAYANALIVDASRNISEGLPLEILNARGVLMQEAGGRYIITASLSNPNPITAQQVQVIASLFDETQALVGYRILTVPGQMPPGTHYPMRIEIVPQFISDNLDFQLVVEARPVQNEESGARWADPPVYTAAAP